MASEVLLVWDKVGPADVKPIIIICRAAEDKPCLEGLFRRSSQRLPTDVTATKAFRIHNHDSQIYYTSLQLKRYLGAAQVQYTLQKAIMERVSPSFQ